MKITATWIRHSPEKAVDAGRVLKRQLPTGTGEMVSRVSSRLGAGSDLVRAFRRGVDQQALKRAGATDDTAEALAGVLRRLSSSADEVADLANRIEGFEDLSGAQKQLVIRTLDESGDAGRLADSYDARTLERLAAAGSGGDKGDDVLSKADEAAAAGKSEEVARLADELDPRTLAAVLRTDEVTSAYRLVDEAGDDGARLLNDLDPRASSRLLEISSGEAAGMRASLARYQDEIGTLRIERFALDAKRLEHIDGFDRMIRPISRAGQADNIPGHMYEARVAARLGEGEVASLSKPITDSGGNRVGEVDLVLESGRLVEVKNVDLSQVTAGESRYATLENQLRNTYPQHGDELHDVTVVGTEVPSEGDSVYDLARTIETDFARHGEEYSISFSRVSET